MNSVLQSVSPVVPTSFAPFPDVYEDECPELPEHAYYDPDAEDERWWSRQSLGGWVDGQLDPTDTFNLTIAATDYPHEEMVRDLSDDFTGGAFAGREVAP